MVSSLLSLSRQPAAPPTLVRQTFRYLYLISKVRGPKVVVRWFPHEVSDLEPVLWQLENQDTTEYQVRPHSTTPDHTAS